MVTTTPYPAQHRRPSPGEPGRRRLAQVLSAPTVPLWQLPPPALAEDVPLLRRVWRLYFDEKLRQRR